MIKSVKITNFKKIKDCSLDLDRINIFVGSNNSGKSSVLQAIQFAIGTAQTGSRVGTRVNQSGDAEVFTADTSAFLYLPIRELDALIHNKKLTQSAGADISFTSEFNDTTISIKRGKNRNLAVSMKRNELLDVIKNSQKPYCVYTPGLSGISISEEYKTKAVVLKSATRGDSNLYLRNVLYLLKAQEYAWNEFTTAFNLFFPEYIINVDFSPETDETIDAYVEIENEEEKGIRLPIDAMGTSALQILQILSYVYYFNPPMLILDEPDTHLHANNQRALLSLLNERSIETGMQILIATHSRHIIDEARDAASFFWMQNGTLRKKITEEDKSQKELVQVMMDLGAMDVCDLSNPNIKWVICTEDANVNCDKFLRAVLVSSGFDLSKCKVISYQGCGKVDSVAFLKEFLNEYIPNMKMIVHRDRDYLLDEEIENFKRAFRDKGIYTWVTPGTDLEAMFVNKDHIASVYSDLTEDQINEILNKVYEDERVREASLDRLSLHLQKLDREQNSNPRHESNPREISRNADELYNDNPGRYLYGKRAFGILKSVIQDMKKDNSLLISKSRTLYQNELNRLLRE